MRREPLALLGRQRLVHRFRDGRDLRITGVVQERLPWPRLHRPDLGLQLELDREEARLPGELDQIALVEVEHRIARRLDVRIDLLDALGQVGEAGARVAPKARTLLLHAEAVDRLEAREAPSWPEDPEELTESPLLLGHVDQHRARRDNIGAQVVYPGELGRARLDEAGSIGEAQRLGRLT